MHKNLTFVLGLVFILLVLYCILNTEHFGGNVGSDAKMMADKAAADKAFSDKMAAEAKAAAEKATASNVAMVQAQPAQVAMPSQPKQSSNQNEDLKNFTKVMITQTDNLFRSLLEMSQNSSSAQIAILQSMGSSNKAEKDKFKRQAVQFSNRLQKSANTAKQSLDFYKTLANETINKL